MDKVNQNRKKKKKKLDWKKWGGAEICNFFATLAPTHKKIWSKEIGKYAQIYSFDVTLG